MRLSDRAICLLGTRTNSKMIPRTGILFIATDTFVLRVAWKTTAEYIITF